MKVRILLSLAFVLILAPLARADILFIDLNCSAAEIAAAKQAAAARGEKLVLLPPRTRRQQRVFSEMHDIDLNLDKAVTQQQMERLQASKKKLQDQLAAGHPPGGTPWFSVSQLDSVLRRYSSQHKSFETIIISGHHVDGFFGQFGTLNEEDVVEAFAKYPKLKDAVRAYFGWGCYTNTLSESEAWQNAFPRIEVTGGFDGSAPGGESLSDGGFLAGVLSKEYQLEKTAKPNPSKQQMHELARMIRAIQDFNETNAAVCTCDECVGKNTGEVAVGHDDGCDEFAEQALEEGSDVALNAARMIGPPCNTQESPLRAFYDLARQKTYCGISPETAEEFRGYTSEADPALRWIYMRQVLKNFYLYYGDQIRGLSGLARCGVKVPDFTKNLACTVGSDHETTIDPSQDGNLRLDDVNKFWGKLEDGRVICPTATVDELQKMLKLACEFDHLTDVPSSWVEPAENRSELAKPSFNCDL